MSNNRCVYAFDGLDKLEKQLATMIQQDFPVEFERLVIELASELHDQVLERTPVRTSNLQGNWKIGDIVKKGSEYYIEVYNNVEYAEFVEYDHRKQGSNDIVEGKHMMEISLAVIEARLPIHMQNWLSLFLDEHF